MSSPAESTQTTTSTVASLAKARVAALYGDLDGGKGKPPASKSSSKRPSSDLNRTTDTIEPELRIVRSKGKDKQVVLASRTITTHKQTRTVLSEEKYLEKLDEILERDFFPDIKKLKAQTEYTDALARNDVAAMRALQMRYSTSRATSRRLDSIQRADSPTRRASLLRPDTDQSMADDIVMRPRRPTDSASAAASSAAGTSKSSGSAQLNIDGFLDKFTSEDNASFEELSQLSDRRARLKREWMYRAELEHNESKINYVDTALAPADEQMAIAVKEDDRPNNLDNWRTTAHNMVLYHPEEVALTAEERLLREKKAMREIRRANTRFAEVPFKESIKNESMTKAALMHAAVQIGRVDATGNIVNTAQFGQAIQHKFGNVVTPSPMPGVDASPLMTWGEIEGTPFRLDAGDMAVRASDLDGPTFKMPAVPQREQLAYDMTDTIAKRYHDKRRMAVDAAAKAHVKTPSFGSARSTERLASMSPAARRLASGKLGIKLSSDSALKRSYTPSRRSTATPSPLRPTHLTPSSSRPDTRSPAVRAKTVTDMINKRTKATDFFQ